MQYNELESNNKAALFMIGEKEQYSDDIKHLELCCRVRFAF